ncbi:helix-turn-helix domain-containing protein [Pseudonocardia nematodicida]|uniref:Helix-turn-helix domain-containing protein n=1 Tax=Pseudonocardia nematodicida TaxID=1206997 RepID=A0ABV1KIW6_9PSEU
MSADHGIPPARSGDATRRALLAAAGDLFTEHGYDRTSVRAIAERAGVNQTLLFRYFGSKDALYARVAAERALAVLHGGPPEELLERTLRSILDGPRSGPEHDLFGSIVRSAGTSEAAAAVRAELAGAFTAAFAAQAGGAADERDAALRAELLLSWLLGLSLLHPLLPGGETARARTDDVIGHVGRGARALLDGSGPPLSEAPGPASPG